MRPVLTARRSARESAHCFGPGLYAASAVRARPTKISSRPRYGRAAVLGWLAVHRRIWRTPPCGYFRRCPRGNDIVVLTEPKPDAPVRYRATSAPAAVGFLCIADFIRSRELAERMRLTCVESQPAATSGSADRDPANEPARVQTPIVSDYLRCTAFCSSPRRWPSTGTGGSG